MNIKTSLYLFYIMTSVNRRQGHVKWFSNQYGYGFITFDKTDEQTGEDIFVHHSALQTSGDQFRYLVEGEYVSFDITCGENGKMNAVNVTGSNGGQLMCETRHVRNELYQSKRAVSEDGTAYMPKKRTARQTIRVSNELNDGSIWELVRRTPPHPKIVVE